MRGGLVIMPPRKRPLANANLGSKAVHYVRHMGIELRFFAAHGSMLASNVTIPKEVTVPRREVEYRS